MSPRRAEFPTPLILPAFAKINLGLQVLGRRPDGYHELRTVYQTISLADRLVFERAERLSLSLESASGRAAPLARGSILPERRVPEGEENLVLRAARAFGDALGRVPRVRITLTKTIPAGAGLGGGSSDAAVTLLALNRLHGFPLDATNLARVAASLGSDVPFFLLGGTALGLGRGEIVRALKDGSQEAAILIVDPGFAVSTAEAFGRFDPVLTRTGGQISIYRFSRQGVRERRKFLVASNDLEPVVMRRYPRLARLVRRLRRTAATTAAMTGSGSAVYALFERREDAVKALRELEDSTALVPVQGWVVRRVGAAEYAARLPARRHPQRRHREGT